MNPITPIQRGTQGAAVANLHEGLLFLVRNQVGISDNDRRTLEQGLASELREQAYKDWTAHLVSLFQEQLASRFKLIVNGDVDQATADALNKLLAELGAPGNGGPAKPPPYTVSGTVRLADGSPARATSVQAVDRDLRSEQLLGQARTDDAGAYRIGYSDEQFRKRERGSADLVVKALAPDGSLLAASPVLFNAPPQATIDLTIPAQTRAPPTLFENIAAALPPLLDGVKVEELEENQQYQDVTFLAGETGFAKRDLARFVLAQLLAPQGIQAEFWFALLGGSLFLYAADQSLKAQLSTLTDGLPALDAGTVRNALGSAFDRKDIPDALRGHVDEWIAAFLKIAARLTVRPTAAPTFTKQALDNAGIADAAKQEKFALLFNQYQAMTPDLVAALQKDSTFAPAEVANLRASYQLADLTRGDFTVVKTIKDAFGVREPAQIRALAGKSESEWVDLVKRGHAAGTLTIPLGVSQPAGAAGAAGAPPLSDAELYGKTLERQFRESFPTAAFAGGLGRALGSGGARGLRHGAALRDFLQQHDNFELLTTPIDDFLKTSVNPAMRTLAQDEGFRTELKAAQRVFKLAPTFEATDTLIAGGLHSAQQIYRRGEGEFVQSYAGTAGFTADSARLAWNRAADTHAAVLTVVGELTGLDSGSLPAALRTSSTSVATFPNWNNLFQSGDLCACEDCRSVLGPAAYFADLLTFLKDRKAADPTVTVKDVLFKRRPDLGFIELNCENALTPLPYIDVVCEVLEAVVAGGAGDVLLTGFNAMPTASVAAKSAVAAQLSSHHLNPGADFSLSQIDPNDPNRWVVHGDEATFLLSRSATTDFSARILRNTKASAAELRAYPAYVDAAAYATLRAGRFPFVLPFDLFAEEVRAAFRKCNLQRWDLMRTLRGSAAPNNPTDGEIAAEYFGISCGPPHTINEKDLILAADPNRQQDIWGETGNADWLDTAFADLPLPSPFPPPTLTPRIALVKTFLLKTGLEYEELFALLDLPFLNQGGAISIKHLDTSCDTDKKVILGLDTTNLDRIHRFLRLWRKLGWPMWEVDLVIRSAGIGAGALDEAFLINLYYFARVRARLGDKTTAEQLCALCGDLNTETHFTKLYEKRGDGLYQSLFLNKRLIQPLDHAFDVTALAPGGQQISGHTPVMLAALRVSETDLAVFKSLTRASNNAPYLITDDLTLGNISFLWRHAWLSRQLKLKPQEWAIVLKLFQQDVQQFANPRAAFEFVEKFDLMKAAGFTPDELDWLLAANRGAKAATKEADAARFLIGLRKDLQDIHAEFDPAQYPFLDPPSQEDSLTGLLTSLLKKLNRDEAATNLFLKVLRGSVSLRSSVDGLPAGFTFPPAITAAHIPIQYDETAGVLHFAGVMTEAQKTLLLSNALPAAVTSNPAYAGAIDDLFRQSLAAFDNYASVEIDVTLPGGVTLPGDRPSLPIRYNPTTQKLRFVGVMAIDERQSLMAAGNPAAAITELFYTPRLAVKFYEPVFTAPLSVLPATVDFKAQLSADLAAKISYDVEQRLLRFAGIMSSTEQAALNALIPVLPSNAAYHAAIDGLAAQPMTAIDDRVWLTDNDLDPALPANDTWTKRMANAAKKALDHLAKTFAANGLVQQAAAQLGLTDALTRHLLSQYAVLPNSNTLLAHLTGPFAASGGTVDYPAQTSAFDGWYWASRVAALWKKWKIVLADWEKLATLTPSTQLLDLLGLPLNAAGTIAPVNQFLRASRLLRIKASLPETGIAFLDVLQKLAGNGYPTANDFAADVTRLNDSWTAADILALIGALDARYTNQFPSQPNDYLLAETWERLYRAYYFLDSLNAGASRVLSFAAAIMGAAGTATLKQLLRSKFGVESWLALSADIQDALRERKRDALAAYLLAQPMPADAPSGKWENTNDLYAYYLLDVEMSSCQLTSRLVQASGSVQLFVQRCFMGLEPDVIVQPDGATGDSAWKWWRWMHKFQVWVANRKVFLWPENWIEPELKKDRSPFFKDLENELLQNEINQYNAETAFANYLEKLDGVAQLEIAGFYQEDEGDDAVVHVFGRTRGAEPHLYYYRRYDYRQWTPWEKVELDIQGDYLIPAVVASRLLLFWPVFTDVPDEVGNRTVPTPTAGGSATLQDPAKRLRLQMAVSDYRQGKWSPKRISKDFNDRAPFRGTSARNHYRFRAIDRSAIDDRFGIVYRSDEGDPTSGRDGAEPQLIGAFEISGCAGVPTTASFPFNFKNAIQPDPHSAGTLTTFMKWIELANRPVGPDGSQDDFTLQVFGANSPDGYGSTRVLMRTPGLFLMTPAWQLSYLDTLLLDGQSYLAEFAPRQSSPFGSWLPFFYNDKQRTFFVLPSQRGGRNDNNIAAPAGGSVRTYYPAIKRQFLAWENAFDGQIRTWLKDFSAPAPGTAGRHQLEQVLSQQFPAEPPPYTDAQIKELLLRFYMRFVHYYLGQIALWLFQQRQFHFKNFYHPFVCDFIKLVANPLQGIPGLMRRETQLGNTGFGFKRIYQPTFWVVDPTTEDLYPKEIVDFSPDGAYSSYNWELFYHAPLLIANALSRNQRFEEARDWYHFIFNPIGVASAIPGGSPTSSYWITKPFFETTDPQYVQQRIDNILRMLNGNADLESQVRDWRTNPFDPHRIANYRTVAYQKTVVMKYLDNLIAWGDFLFAQDSMESINEATQLYVLAAEILGPRPKKIPPQAKPPLSSFNELESEFDAFSNALVQVENLVPQPSGTGGGGNAPPLPMLYFCIPRNDKMLGYWDTVADRLYKIRHCMNILGVVRQLALFEPPIDPAALVKAIAAGVDIGSALADLNAPLPLYRFNVLLQKANEICNDVKALGSALLSALEKKDAEALSLLRQSQEIRVLEATKAVREKQVEEAKQNLDGVRKSRVIAETRRNYYRDIQRLTGQETLYLDKMTESHKKQEIAQGIKIVASIVSLLPGINLGASGFGGTPHATVKFGGIELGQAASLASDVLSFLSQIAANDAAMASSKAGFDRRWDDWKLQERLADRELDQFDSQIAAAELRIAIAQNELDNHVIQIENAKAVNDFMRSKYTNEDLYLWQVGEISGVYFQSYKLAYDLAKRAERCFRFELGLQDSSFISFGYWDSLKKGLLSGEKLQYDLRRLESAYLEQNRRELELTKHFSLLLNDPLALVQLRETGTCFLHLPEEVFDLDYPGHYFRRIKSVAITLPCVTGPYTTIACTLRLLKNSIRINTANGDNGYARNTDQGLPVDDARFVENNVPFKAIAASSAQNDSGVFELNFRDDRYLPFEGAGAISEWSLELFADSTNADFGKPLRQFDYGTISDAIVHIKYTAREDAGPFKNGALKHLRDYFHQVDPTPSLRLFNLRQEFPSQWSRFLNPAPSTANSFGLDMSADLFRTLDAGKTLKVNTIWLLARCTGADTDTYSVTMTPLPLPAQPLALTASPQFGELRVVALASQTIEIGPTVVTWTIEMTRTVGGTAAQPIDVEDLFLVLGYDWS
jgi:hypothetical protein